MLFKMGIWPNSKERFYTFPWNKFHKNTQKMGKEVGLLALERFVKEVGYLNFQTGRQKKK